MKELLKLDKVAYIRFASVYKSFQDVGDFSEAVDEVVREGPAKNHAPAKTKPAAKKQSAAKKLPGVASKLTSKRRPLAN